MLQRSFRIIASLLCVTLLGFTSGCETPGGSTSRVNPKIPEAASSALLRPGDSLGIVLQGIPSPTTHDVQIDDQGLISLPYIDGVTAAGLTASDLSASIRETYISRDFYKTINVSVSVTERFV